MGTVILLYHRRKFLIILRIKQGILCLFETIIISKMMTKLFTFILVVAFIGCTFADEADLQRRDEVDGIESPEERELGSLEVEMNAIRSQGLNRGDCIPLGKYCAGSGCCSGSSCKRYYR